MEPLTIIALILAGGAVVGGGIPLFKKIYSKIKSDGMSLDTAKEIWAENSGDLTDFVGEVTELIREGKAMSKAVDDQASAVDRIDQDKALREALIETAQKHGPEALQALANVLTPVPKGFEKIAGIDVNKMTKLKEAQREGLSDKEAWNKVLGDSGKMLRGIIDIAGEVLPTIIKLKK